MILVYIQMRGQSVQLVGTIGAEQVIKYTVPVSSLVTSGIEDKGYKVSYFLLLF